MHAGTLCIVYTPPLSALVSYTLRVPGQICKMEFSETASPTRGTFHLAIPDRGLAMEGTLWKSTPSPAVLGKEEI